MLVLCIPIIIGGISIIHSSKALQKGIEIYNIAMMEQAKEIIDERLRSIDQLVTDIALNPRIGKFLYSKKPTTAMDIWQMKDIMSDMGKYKATNAFIHELFIYYNNTNLILRHTGKYESDIFLEEYLNLLDTNLNKRKDMLLDFHYKKYLPVQSVALGHKDVIPFFHSLPISMRDQSLGTLGLLIDSNLFESVIKQVNVINKGTIYIINNNKEKIATVGDVDLPLDILDSLYKNNHSSSDYFYDTINGVKYIITYTSSDYNNWKYISIMPTIVFMSGLRTIQNLMFAISTIGFLIGVILVYVLARNSYLPIQRLVGNFQNIVEERSHLRNEFVFLDEVTKKTILENKNIKNMLEKQQPIIKSNILIQLLNGGIDDNLATSAFLSTFNIKLPYELFCVLTIHIDDDSAFVHNDSFKERNLLNLVVTNIVEEFANRIGVAYAVDMAWDDTVVLLNLRGIHQDCLEQIRIIAHSTVDILKKEFSIHVSIGIGSMCNEMGNIRKSYLEALKAVEYKMLKGKSSVTVYQEIQRSQHSYYYPLDIEVKLINVVKGGDTEKALHILNDIFKMNFFNNIIPIEMARCLFFDITSTMIKMFDEIFYDDTGIFNIKYEQITKLTQCQTVDEMYTLINEIIINTCGYINQNKKSHNLYLKEEILLHIEQNHCNNIIGLNSIAEKLGITPSYLAHFFKEQTGKSVMEYINCLRIMHTKQLLASTNETLTDIANKVGYTNSAILIRTFKKMEGVTPGSYRNSVSQSLDMKSKRDSTHS